MALTAPGQAQVDYAVAWADRGYIEVRFRLPQPSGGATRVFGNLEYSEDGVSWALVPAGDDLTADPTTGLTYGYDHTARHGVFRHYRVVTRALSETTGETSARSVGTSYGYATLYVTDWWLKDVYNPGLNIKLDVAWQNVDLDAPMERTFTYVPGRETPLVDQGSARAETIKLGLYAPDRAAQQRLVRLHHSLNVLLLQSDLGEQWWVQLEASMPRKRRPSAGSEPDYDIDATFREVDGP